MSGELNPDAWRRIGAVLDRLSSIERPVSPEALADICQAEGVRAEDVGPFLAAEHAAEALPESIDPATLEQAVRAFAGDRLLAAGDRLGAYEVLEPIGSGGMGDVYKARDTRLGRTVALKRLQADLAARPEGRLRFQREARAISTLNHPHICTLHDVGEHDGIEFLVMELVDGETLASRLRRRALPLADALEYAAQIADALAAAHQRGVVHRDLKPANVMLTTHGVKVLDFGLAELLAPREQFDGMTHSSLTAEGTILGTPQYMAPEQLQGKPADPRTDVFALGAILYEMLAGRKAFDGDDPASIIAAVLEREPAPVTSARSDAPPSLDWLIAQCLAKDPDRRWQSAADLARHLRWIDANGAQPAQPRRRPIMSFAIASATALVAIATAIVAYVTLVQRRDTETSTLFRYELPPPDRTRYEQLLALSPDGKRLAFSATDARGASALWVRPLDGLKAERLEGTDGAFFPFWKPDGSAIGFFANGALKRVDLSTGTVRTICTAGFGGGGTWNSDDVILFASESAFNLDTRSSLQRVSASGGAPTPAVTERNPFDRRVWPHFLPDGRHYLYMGARGGEAPGVYVGRLDSDDHKGLVTAGQPAPALRDANDLLREFPTGLNVRANPNTRAVYASGHLFYLRERALVSRPFDVSRLEFTGDPVRIADAVWLDAPGRSAFDVSASGVLAYRPPATPDVTQLTWFDRHGVEIGRVGDAGPYRFVALSRDGRSVLTTRQGTPQQAGQIVRIDVESGASVPVAERGSLPVWSPDGSRFAYRRVEPLTHIAPADGSDLVGRPLSSLLYALPFDWSRDGRLVIGQVYQEDTSSYDIWSSVVGTGTFTMLLKTRFAEVDPQLSPDQHWLAYASNDSGRFEVYVRPFDRTGPVVPVSRNGGRRPRWNSNGRDLFFTEPDGRLMRATLSTKPLISVSAREPVFTHVALSYRTEAAVPINVGTGPSYAVAPDDQRFLLPVLLQESKPSPVVVLSNWLPLVK